MHPTKEIRNTERKHISPITIPLPNPHHSSPSSPKTTSSPSLTSDPPQKENHFLEYLSPGNFQTHCGPLWPLWSLSFSPLPSFLLFHASPTKTIQLERSWFLLRVESYFSTWRGNISGKEMRMRFGSMHFWHASRRGSLPLAQTEGVECRTHVGKSDNE